MVYTYTPAYYSSLHDTITSLCKNILPFSRKRGLPASEKKLSKKQSENLKWQQESFHRILNLIGLHKEGMVPEKDVLAFRSHLLDTLISAPADQEQPVIIRDKLLFLQELLYAKCISADEYHSSKRPLLQRLAVQGAEIEARDIIVAGQVAENSEEEWSNIDFRDEETLMDKENSDSKKSKHKSSIQRIKGAASMISFGKMKPKKGLVPNSVGDPLRPLDPNIRTNAKSNSNPASSFSENPFWGVPMTTKEIENGAVLMGENTPVVVQIKAEKERGSTEKVKKKSIRTLFGGENISVDTEEKGSKSVKKQWGFDGFKKWKRNESEDEEAPLPLGERSDNCDLVCSPIGEGPDTKLIKKKIHSDGSSSDFFIDKVLGDNIKKELSRIQTELCTKNPNLQFSNDQIEAISTRLPVDKADLNKFFPKSWCDRYGDVVLDVVKKEFKDHVGEMENLRRASKDNNNKHGSSARWVSFDDDSENHHPNLFAHSDQSSSIMTECSVAKGFAPRSFLSDSNGEKLVSESAVSHSYNPFWSPKAHHL